MHNRAVTELCLQVIIQATRVGNPQALEPMLWWNQTASNPTAETIDVGGCDSTNIDDESVHRRSISALSHLVQEIQREM